MHPLIPILLAMVWGGAAAEARAFDPALARSMVKVMAYSKEGRVAVGSGVVVGTGRVATNCHVTRAAHSIALFQGAMRYEVLAQAAAPELDLCLLHTASKLPAVQLGSAVPGEAVYFYGYPNAIGLSVTKTVVRRLHPYRGGQIIEIEAGFMHGFSGGGLFNEQGELIGLTTFMRNRNPPAFYAIPSSWLIEVSGRQAGPVGPLLGRPFWQTDPNFLKGKL